MKRGARSRYPQVHTQAIALSWIADDYEHVTRIVRRQDALTRGITDSELQRYCRTESWKRLRPGAFVSRGEFDALDAVDKHRVIAEAVLGAARTPDAVLSHVSAAVVHGLSVWGLPLRKVHVTRNRRSGARTSSVRVLHCSPYHPHEIVDVDGIRVTSIGRTIADIARSEKFEPAVCAADEAARLHNLTSTEVVNALDLRPTHSGNAAGLRVANFMNGLAESVGESRTRVTLAELGYHPELQTSIVVQGKSIARIDFYLRATTTACEFDGKIKYGRLVPEGSTAHEVVWREKLREDAIRDAGIQVVRLTWADLSAPAEIRRRLEAAALRAAKSPPPTAIAR